MGERGGHTFKINLKYKLHHSFGEQFGNFYQSSKSLNPLSQSFHFQKLSQGHKHTSQNVFTRIFTAPLTVNQMSNRGQNESIVVHPLPQAVAFPGCHSPAHFSVFFTKSASQSPHWLSQ